jgi:hypothetical protein
MKKIVVSIYFGLASSLVHPCNPQPFRWEASAVPIFYRYAPSSWHIEFSSSMRRWNDAAAAIRLQPGYPGGIGPICGETNTTMFVRSVCRKNWDAGVLAVTLVEYNPVNGIIKTGRILFNSNEKFSIYRGANQPGKPDFQRVALHEMGHFLGLNHESRVASIMAPFVGNTETLQLDDIACLKKIYPVAEPVL